MTIFEHIHSKISKLQIAIDDKEHTIIASLLREYVYINTLWGEDSINSQKYNINKLSADEIFQLIQAREITFLCGSTAIYLCKIYELFGYQSYVYNYGIQGVSTHVVSIVHLESIGNVIQDPSFNISYYDKNHNILDLKRLQTIIKNKEFNNIIIKKGKIIKRTIYFSDNIQGSKLYQNYKNENILIDGKKYYSKSEISSTPYYYCYGDLDYHTSYLRRNKTKIINAINIKNNTSSSSVFELLTKKI